MPIAILICRRQRALIGRLTVSGARSEERAPRSLARLTSRDAGFEASAYWIVPLIEGWVFEGNVVQFLEHVSRYTGYEYDELDEVALTGALDGTDDESSDGWFSYPLAGTPALVVHLAQAVGGSVVSVRLEGDVDAVLAARFETLFDLL